MATGVPLRDGREGQAQSGLVAGGSFVVLKLVRECGNLFGKLS